MIHTTQWPTVAILRANLAGTTHADLRDMTRSVFVDEAAQLLGVSRRTVYYRIRQGKLRTIRTACGSQRVLVESIEALLREDLDELTARGAAASNRDPSAKYRAI
jgi:excisionase family DNA binding protein